MDIGCRYLTHEFLTSTVLRNALSSSAFTKQHFLQVKDYSSVVLQTVAMWSEPQYHPPGGTATVQTWWLLLPTEESLMSEVMRVTRTWCQWNQNLSQQPSTVTVMKTKIWWCSVLKIARNIFNSRVSSDEELFLIQWLVQKYFIF